VLSVVIFHDRLNAFKLIGIVIVVTGVAVLGGAQES
jgi:multidrug transporter EmrE-like cation transporter